MVCTSRAINGGAISPIININRNDCEYRKNVNNNQVYFDFGKSNLNAKARKILDKQAIWLSEHENVRVLVEGYCDARGTREYNLVLGKRRADAVKQYLATKGIGPARIDTASVGADRPAVAGSGKAARSQRSGGLTN